MFLNWKEKTKYLKTINQLERLHTEVTTLENNLALSGKVKISNNLTWKQCCCEQQKTYSDSKLDKLLYRPITTSHIQQ